MRNIAPKLALVAVCCLTAAVLAPAGLVEEAFADMASAASGASADGDSHERTESPLNWLFSFLLGKPADDSASSGASPSGTAGVSASGSSESASAASEPASNSLSGPVESETDAINRIHDCLLHAGKQVPEHITCEKVTPEGRYLIHGSETVRDTQQQGSDFDPEDGDVLEHEATFFWYSVGKDGSIYDEIMMCDIDPETMDIVGLPAVPENDYYSLTLPAELAGSDITYEEGHFGGPTTAGAITGVVMDGLLQFEVVVLSDDWGPQGDMAIVKIGTPSTDPSSVVYLTVPVGPVDGGERDPEAAQAKAQEYAPYVSLK